MDLRMLGEARAARDLDQDTLERRRHVLGPDHPDTLSSAHNLALDLPAMGRPQEPRDGESAALSVVAGCADRSRSVAIDPAELVATVFPGLSALVIEDVEDAGEVVWVRARTRGGAVACPGCGTKTARVHGYHGRTVADVPVGDRRVVVCVRVRRMRCAALGCAVQTFREQVPGVLDRYQRRTARLTLRNVTTESTAAS
jgi:hypothetical protein